MISAYDNSRRYILFDLDGTLTDSHQGVLNGFNYALAKMGRETMPEDFRELMGPPLHESYRRFCGLSDAEIDTALDYFHEYYQRIGIFENRVYPDIEEMLKTLNAHGKKLMVATSKPEHFARQVLDHFHLTDYFCFICGVTEDTAVPSGKPGARVTKADVIGHILSYNGILDPENAVMVGDRAGDIVNGKRYGLETIGVGYGFGSREELEGAGADHFAETPMRVAEIIIM